MDQERLRYISYLLRMWQVESQGRAVWRATLEFPQTGKVIGFPDLDSLFTYLEQETRVSICVSRQTDRTEINDKINPK
jgi:hypothetical protein